MEIRIELDIDLAEGLDETNVDREVSVGILRHMMRDATDMIAGGALGGMLRVDGELVGFFKVEA